jgi:hypothetical protein
MRELKRVIAWSSRSCLKRRALAFALCLGLTSLQLHCDGQKTSQVPEAMRSHSDSKEGTLKQVELDFTSDDIELSSSQCTNLRLNAYNGTSHSVHWSEDWLLEQEGPGRPFPESVPHSALELAPGKTLNLILVRLCASELAPGEYRFRITAASKSENPFHSDWVTIKIL